MDNKEKAEILILASSELEKWYPAVRRELPWRKDRDPYHVWVSEIMLQQTRIQAVIPYYQRFISTLPDLRALADCPEDQLLKLWEGLGYYSRVRNMQKAARIIMEQYQGEMPDAYQKVLGLPGIGAYTAGAICSISFRLAVPAVDGNVMRIVSRLTLDRADVRADRTKKEMTAWLAETMSVYTSAHPDADPGLVNQALMELGETVCLPGDGARCGICPLASLCAARKNSCVSSLPVRSAPKKRRVEKRTILVIRDGIRVLLDRRPDKGLLAGMYEFPGMEGFCQPEEAADFVKKTGFDPVCIEPLPDAKHIFTHVEWHMKAYQVLVVELIDRKGFLAVTPKEAEEKYALPGAFAVYARLLGTLIGKEKFADSQAEEKQ